MADSKQDKIWAAAVKRAVHRRIENEEGKPQKIERLADQLVEFALEGNGWAVKEIGERLDGKPSQDNNTNLNVAGSLELIKRVVR